MSNIQIYNQNSQKLTEVAFVKNTLEQVKVRDITNSLELIKRITLFIADTAELMRVKNEVPDHIKREIKELITTQFKNLSMDEIYYAFKLERFGKLGEERIEHYQIFDAVYVSSVLSRYVEWKRKVKSINNISAEKSQPEITPEEREVIREQFLKNVFDELKENGYCRDAWLLYDDLEAQDKLVIGKSRKKQIYADQKKIYTRELQQSMDRNLVRSTLEKLRDGLPNAELKIRSKAYCVSEYLRDYLESFEEFKTHIEK